jgi:hypothetical protein
MSCLVTWPWRQISGISHLGSAFFSRPTLRRNQTAPSGSRRGRSLVRELEPVGGRRAPRSRGAPRRGRTGGGRRRRRTGPQARAGAGAIEADQGGGDMFGAAALQQGGGQGRVLGRHLAAARIGSSSIRSWSRLRIDSTVGGPLQMASTPARADQLLGLAAAVVTAPAGRDALAAGAAGAAAAVKQGGAVLRQVGVDDEVEVRQVEAACRHVGGDADPRARPSRRACRAWVRSFWLSSPDRATAEKPRSPGWRAGGAPPRGWSRTPGRARLEQAQHVDDGVLELVGATTMARYSMSPCGSLRAMVSMRRASRW